MIRRPLPELFREHGVRYVVLDTLYAQPEELRLDAYCAPRGRYSSFELYEARATTSAA